MPPKRPPPEADAADDALAIAIDPDLLEAALASVEKHLHHKAAPSAPAPEPADDLLGIDVEIEADFAAERPAPPSADTSRLQVELREANARARQLEEELIRMVRLRDQAEGQLREVRKAAKEAQADFERVRARGKKERDDAERAAEERLLREVLETGDNLERAWQHAMSDPESLLGGLQMIVEQFRGVLRRLGVDRVVADRGTPFDPEVHEAVMHVPAGSVEPGTVVDEISPGYRLRGRLFRPARVTVASPP